MPKIYPQTNPRPLKPPRLSSARIVSFTCGILSLLLCGIIYAALPLAIIAINQGDKGKRESGSHLAGAGKVLGIIGLTLTTIIIIPTLLIVLSEII